MRMTFISGKGEAVRERASCHDADHNRLADPAKCVSLEIRIVNKLNYLVLSTNVYKYTIRTHRDFPGEYVGGIFNMFGTY